MENVVSFSIIGGSGFRAQFYLRIAKQLPHMFRVSGMVVRDEDIGKKLEQRWNVTTYRNVEELLENESPEFVVLSVSKSISTTYLIKLSEMGIPVLAETPPASDLESLVELYEKVSKTSAKVQVAEQYHLQPNHASRLSVIKSGRIGNISETTVSISHYYHGVSLIRKYLGIGFENCVIKGMKFHSPIIGGPGRSGPPKKEQHITVQRDMAWLQFGGKLGVYDFTKDQHRSWIRSNHVSIRGERGEIFDDSVKYLLDYKTPIYSDLKRISRGEKENLEGYYLEGVLLGESWLYRNPFAPARLFDDEIAIATCLKKMGEFVAGGPSFYSLAEASQDQYIGLMIEKAIHTGETISTIEQPWARIEGGIS
ncbi:Gfo/Idh/MocA family protein [Evansella sp. AB-rgal1]|uniref:Gfo/Idh/MocA family protein n=1 Tax=Evansella sp. AB-rgal1 TaxID=3242696 RepID=UPI00359EB1CA